MAATDTPRHRRELRRRFRSRRRSLDNRTQAAHAGAATRHFFTTRLPWHSRTVGVYLANDGELDATPLLKRLLEMRKRVALPVVSRGGALSFYRYRPGGALIVNRFGIPEPAPGAAFVHPLALDLLLMPLVAFDSRGVRLGMGAGYYDRFLARIPPPMRPLLVGLAHEVQRSPEPLPTASWDVPLDGVITEAGWQGFHNKHTAGGSTWP